MSVVVPIDPRVHRRLIGTKGRTIRKFMDTYRVDIRFPSLNTSDPVVISGLSENVEEAKDQLLLLEEEYVSIYKHCHIFVEAWFLSEGYISYMHLFL